MKEEEERVTAECEELERTKERVRERLTRLQLQRQGDLEQTRLQWAAVQKELRVLDVEELRSYRAPPPPVIMVTDVLCTVFGREPGWENAKLLLGQDHFYQDLQFYDGHKMADSVFSSLSRAVRRPDFSVHLVQPVSAAAGSLCHWLRGLQRYCSVLRRLEKGRALLSEVEAEDLRVAQKIADQRLRQEKVMRHKDQCAQNLQKSLEAKQELQREAHQLRSKQAQAQQCEGRARPHLTTWTAALEVLQRRRQALQMDALLVSASITYLGCVPWTRCTTLMDKWSSLCCGDEVSLEPDDIREELDTPHTAHSAAGRVLKLLCSPSLRMRWQKERLPITTETLTRASILQARALYSELRPTLILDPDVRAERCLQVLLCAGDQERGKSSQGQGDQTNLLDRTQELCVIDALDMELTQRLSSALELGLCVLIKNVEKMPSCLEMICSVRCRTHCHPLSTSSSMETPSCLPSPPVTRGDGASPSSHVFLSTSLPLKTFIQEVGATFLKEVTVVDLSLGSSGLKEEMVQEIMRFRDPRLQEERWRLSWNALKLMEELRGAEDSLLEYVSTGTVPLVEDKDFLDRVSSCEEAQAMLQPSLLDVEALQQQIGDSMTQYTSAAQNCVHLFARMQEVSRLSPHYHFPASSVLRWALGALSGQAESGRDLEKVLTSGVLRCALPMIAEEHRYILQVLLAVGKPHPLEWFSFLGLACKSSLETSSSCIQRPQWIHISAWEEIAQLEKLSVFQGIRSSLSTQSKQWQEYFTLRSTVIGPVPCSSFSHLTLFQVAILWRILKPECLGLVLSHLTSCILGPGPEDKCEDEEVIGQSDPGSTVLFIVPPVSPDIPMNFIQHMAKKKGTEVGGESMPAAHCCIF
ncbi:hypothetical protein GDO81_000962 [Engystomops pustulosus]|uniref:Dynein heavy chain coiled coil stalk domain-containing protein n=1 Tax=Engystomops pustulosus TaxID=76066 RepID=A0AAV7DA26_ENGPU|nr:hypothetical protein GDO81_000962 [Engystomops pustulosus]